MTVMTKLLKELMESTQVWPEEAQDQAVESLLAIKEEYVGPLSPEERRATGRHRAWKRIEEVTSRVKDLEPNPNEDMTAKEEDIAEMVKEYRRSKHA